MLSLLVPVVPAPKVSSTAARSRAVGADAVVSTVMSSACVVEAALTLPATSVWMARTLWVPAASETSRLNVPPATVVVPRLSPASTTPLLLASSNSVTVAPFSPEPLIVRAEVFLVMLSLLFEPVSSAAARSRPVGVAGGCVSFTKAVSAVFRSSKLPPDVLTIDTVVSVGEANALEVPLLAPTAIVMVSPFDKFSRRSLPVTAWSTCAVMVEVPELSQLRHRRASPSWCRSCR